MTVYRPGMKEHREFEIFLASGEGKKLMEEFGLRRSLSKGRRQMERESAHPIEIHAVLPTGDRQVGTLYRGIRLLSVKHLFPEGTEKHRRLREFANRLGTHFNSEVRHLHP